MRWLSYATMSRIKRRSILNRGCMSGNILEPELFDDYRGNIVIIEDMQWLYEDDSVREGSRPKVFDI